MVRAIDPELLRQAWNELLGRYEWDHFGMFTFRFPVHSFKAESAMALLYRKACARAGRGIYVAYTVEGDSYHHYHVHALLGGTRRFTCESLEKLWSNGFSDVRRYQTGLAGIPYILKTDASLSDVNLSPAFARHASHRVPTEVGAIRAFSTG
jgi:hypothetical protein